MIGAECTYAIKYKERVFLLYKNVKKLIKNKKNNNHIKREHFVGTLIHSL